VEEHIEQDRRRCRCCRLRGESKLRRLPLRRLASKGFGATYFRLLLPRTRRRGERSPRQPMFGIASFDLRGRAPEPPSSSLLGVWTADPSLGSSSPDQLSQRGDNRGADNASLPSAPLEAWSSTQPTPRKQEANGSQRSEKSADGLFRHFKQAQGRTNRSNGGCFGSDGRDGKVAGRVTRLHVSK
jgi:hypothetical protein